MGANQFYKPLADLPRIREQQPGGLCKVAYIPVEWVLNIAPPSYTLFYIDNPAPFGIAAGKDFFFAQAPYHRAYKSESKRGDNGPYVETTVTADLPFLSDDRHMLLDRMKYHKYIVMVFRNDETVYIIGSLDNPAVMVFTDDSGENVRSSSGNTVTFSWVSEDAPLIWKPSI